MSDDIQRSLGHIEGTLSQILSEFSTSRSVLEAHMRADQDSFDGIRNALEGSADERRASIADLDRKIDKLYGDRNKVLGFGYAALGMVSVVGGTIVAIAEKWLTAK